MGDTKDKPVDPLSEIITSRMQMAIKYPATSFLFEAGLLGHDGHDAPEIASVALGSPNAPRPKDAASDYSERLLTAEEAAKRLATSVAHVYRQARNFPFTVRLGKMLRFSESGLNKWIKARSGNG